MDKEEVNDGNKEEVVKAIGQVSKEKKVIIEPIPSIINFRPTNVIDVLLDYIKKIIECNALAFKSIDDTLPILQEIAPTCKVDNVVGSICKLDTLSKFISSNIQSIDKINEETIREWINKEKTNFLINLLRTIQESWIP